MAAAIWLEPRCGDGLDETLDHVVPVTHSAWIVCADIAMRGPQCRTKRR
jgi:hypothetical protein